MLGGRAIRWSNVARVGAVLVSLTVAIVAAPGILRGPKPPPLPSDIGLTKLASSQPPRQRAGRPGHEPKLADTPARTAHPPYFATRRHVQTAPRLDATIPARRRWVAPTRRQRMRRPSRYRPRSGPDADCGRRRQVGAASPSPSRRSRLHRRLSQIRRAAQLGTGGPPSSDSSIERNPDAPPRPHPAPCACHPARHVRWPRSASARIRPDRAGAGLYVPFRCHPGFAAGLGDAFFRRTSGDFVSTSECRQGAGGLTVTHRRSHTRVHREGAWTFAAPAGTTP